MSYNQQAFDVDFLQFLPNSDLLDLQYAPHLWNVNFIQPGEQATRIEGWSLPHGGRTANTALKINGQVFPVTGREKPAGVYAELYPWWPNSAHAGFTVDIPNSLLDVGKLPELTLESVPVNGSPNRPGYTLDMLVGDLNYEIPSKEIAARIGVGEAFHYTLFGRSIYRGFERALARSLGTSFGHASAILDWGCGSGRVSRHVVAALAPGQRFQGFDIDAPAIAWSNEHIGPHFAVSQLDPPLAVDAGSIDIAFAYSVFTHLSEAAFFAWTKEMARVVKPGGALLFTVLGDFAMAALAPGFPRVAHERWRERGIYDDSGNAQLETIGVTGATYRNTWVKRTFVEKALGSDFELVDYVRPFHFYQDLVVARRR